jgi:hypothetical protein
MNKQRKGNVTRYHAGSDTVVGDYSSPRGDESFDEEDLQAALAYMKWQRKRRGVDPSWAECLDFALGRDVSRYGRTGSGEVFGDKALTPRPAPLSGYADYPDYKPVVVHDHWTVLHSETEAQREPGRSRVERDLIEARSEPWVRPLAPDAVGYKLVSGRLEPVYE